MLLPLNSMWNDLVSREHLHSPMNRMLDNHRNNMPNDQLNTERQITRSLSGAVKGLNITRRFIMQIKGIEWRGELPLNTERPITGSFSGAVKGLESLGDSSCRSSALNSLMNDPMTAHCHSLGLSSLVNDLVNLNNLWNGQWNSYVTRLFRSSSVFFFA